MRYLTLLFRVGLVVFSMTALSADIVLTVDEGLTDLDDVGAELQTSLLRYARLKLLTGDIVHVRAGGGESFPDADYIVNCECGTGPSGSTSWFWGDVPRSHFPACNEQELIYILDRSSDYLLLPLSDEDLSWLDRTLQVYIDDADDGDYFNEHDYEYYRYIDSTEAISAMYPRLAGMDTIISIYAALDGGDCYARNVSDSFAVRFNRGSPFIGFRVNHSSMLANGSRRDVYPACPDDYKMVTYARSFDPDGPDTLELANKRRCPFLSMVTCTADDSLYVIDRWLRYPYVMATDDPYMQGGVINLQYVRTSCADCNCLRNILTEVFYKNLLDGKTAGEALWTSRDLYTGTPPFCISEWGEGYDSWESLPESFDMLGDPTLRMWHGQPRPLATVGGFSPGDPIHDGVLLEIGLIDRMTGEPIHSASVSLFSSGDLLDWNPAGPDYIEYTYAHRFVAMTDPTGYCELLPNADMSDYLLAISAPNCEPLFIEVTAGEAEELTWEEVFYAE